MTQVLNNTIGEQTQRAKARFTNIDSNDLKRFIEAQPDIHGSVVLDELTYLGASAGCSNGIAFFTAQLDRGLGRSREQLVLRYFPGVALMKQKSFSDEFFTMRAVSKAGFSVPRSYWLDADGSQLGFPGYVMERVPGDTPSAAMYSQGPLATASPATRKSMMLEAAGFHGRLRGAAIGPQEVPHLQSRGTGATAIEREFKWWLVEVQMSCEMDDPKLEVVRRVYRWLIDNQPHLYSTGLVHGDSQVCNIIYQNSRIAAVIDWEMSYLGHGEADLALLCLFTESSKFLDKPVDGTPTEPEYIERFERESGFSLQYWEYFQLFGIYKFMCGFLLLRNMVPSFESVWEFNLEMLSGFWNKARRAQH